MQKINDDDAAACASRPPLDVAKLILNCHTFVWINSTQQHSHARKAHRRYSRTRTCITPQQQWFNFICILWMIIIFHNLFNVHIIFFFLFAIFRFHNEKDSREISPVLLLLLWLKIEQSSVCWHMARRMISRTLYYAPLQNAQPLVTRNEIHFIFVPTIGLSELGNFCRGLLITSERVHAATFISRIVQEIASSSCCAPNFWGDMSRTMRAKYVGIHLSITSMRAHRQKFKTLKIMELCYQNFLMTARYVWS